MSTHPPRLELLTNLGSLSATVVDQRYADGDTLRWFQFEIEEGGSDISFTLDLESAVAVRDWLTDRINEPTA
jgi:hypothetical protein